MAVRFDRAPITKSEKLPDGRLRVWATFSRVGPLRYLDGAGEQRIEWVTKEELFRTDSLETAALAPVTLGHPEEGMVTPDNWKEYSVGASGSTIKVNPENGLVDVVFVVGAREALDKSDEFSEVSAGYTAQIEKRADGKFYQTNRRYNHLALVERGRAGPEVRLHLDAAEDWAIQSLDECSNTRITDAMKYKGMEMSEDAIKAFKDMEGKLEKMTADMAGMKAKKDAAESDLLTKVTAERDMLQGRVDSLTAERDARMDAGDVEKAAQQLAQTKLDAFQAALPYLPEDTRFDVGVSPLEWKRQAIASANPDLKLDSKDEAYINAAFDMLAQFGAKQRTDEQRADDFKQTLETAQVGGRKDAASLKREDSSDDAEYRADREAATANYVWKEKN
ncbi:DUF2213 domain-containing protein [Leptolyngbyaceae cyanobacterium CCMR0082]|uniref:DUF2213 domain-containing protein n=1 Tax=Adonisia turfae CCMR0082 TaxID=2304604 RepID=A0A6M0SAJ2_9CYAN|nr:DUF2213 domain-containing protein [Adonisia turfae]NEZ65528.1 DUF2213 domain-containing protein [Adonisia turfae CCMR0082]